MNISEKKRFQIPLEDGHPLKSLCWCGDELVDWATGGTRYQLDGTVVRSRFYWGYPFDRAIVSPNGEYAVVYEVLGTKGLVFQGRKLIREINRSYYHADVYEYPIAVFQLPDGQTGIIHCPDEYNRIEIEEIVSGKRLTKREGKSADFFHSRFQVSLNSEFLLSAGWVWHPLDAVQLFRIPDILRHPTVLDKYAEMNAPAELFEAHGAVFQGNESLIMVGDNGGEPGEEGHFLGRYNLRNARVDLTTKMQEQAGTIMSVNAEYIMGFYECPKLIEIASGKIVQKWPELNSGKQNSSIIHHIDELPPLALDSNHMRFAVAGAKGITVIQLG